MTFQGLLDKVLKRTSRDIAFAGAMVGSVSAMSKLFPVMEGYSTLYVTYRDGRWHSWVVSPVKREDCYWRDFLKWYHGRPQSGCYVMRLSDGCEMFLRADIRSYSIKWAERAVSAP